MDDVRPDERAIDVVEGCAALEARSGHRPHFPRVPGACQLWCGGVYAWEVPFQKDYILRMAERLAELAGRILGLRRAGKLDEAKEAAEQAYGELLGLPPGLIDVVDAATLASLVGAPEKYEGVAAVLEADAEVLEARGDAKRAARRRELAAGLRRGR